MKLFFAILFATAVAAFQNEEESSEFSVINVQTDFFQDTVADTAEYNFWSGALAIIARHDTQHRLWAHTFQDLVNASAYEQFGPPGNFSFGQYAWNSRFPSALHRIRWDKITSQWSGFHHEGYTAALKSIPLLLHNAQCEAQENEIWTIIHHGRKAVARRELEQSLGFEDAENPSNLTNALNEAVEQIAINLQYDGLGEPQEEFREKTDSQNGTCRRVQDNKCFDVRMCFEKNMTGDCFDAGNSCEPSSYNIICRNLGEERKDKVTSINTNGGCIVLYAFGNCQMEATRVLSPYTKGHFSLAEIGFDDETRSWRPC